MDVKVSRDGPCIDAEESLKTITENLDTERGRAWSDALDLALLRVRCAIAVDTGRKIAHEECDPQSDWPDDGTELDGSWEHDVIARLVDAGYIAGPAESVWSDNSNTRYLDDGRHVDAVHVVKPFTVVTVDYWAHEWNATGSYATATQWAVTETATVQAGFYVSTSVGDYTLRHVATGWTDESPPCLESIADIDGFDAHTMFATCDACATRWEAVEGSWTFKPDDYCCEQDSGEAWNFGDSPDYDDSTIPCPLGWPVEDASGNEIVSSDNCNGRVHFHV